MNRPALILLLFTGLTAACFSGVLFRGEVLALGESAVYFPPLSRFAADEWLAGRVPLWNPYDGLGTPLAGVGTAAVFYPPQWLFLLPFDSAQVFHAYVLGHLFFAGLGMYALACRFGASPTAAGVACLCYAFSGNVLCLCSNVVLLVGAAWMPWAVLAADRMLDERRLGWAAVLGAVLALMVLGGDPQAAYHAGLLAVLRALLGGSPSRRLGEGRGCPSYVLLPFAATIAAVLAAVQIVPTAELASRSGRTAGRGERTFAERGDEFLCRRFVPGSHEEQRYRFSIAPWRAIEPIWPNVAGRSFPTHHRWTAGIPGDETPWVPSLYMGLLPLVLALSEFRLRRCEPRRRWLSSTVLLFGLGSLGWHGLGWLAQEIHLVPAPEDGQYLVGPPFGGVYWAMANLLPFYDQFRYPAKLLAVAALGMSLLAASGWDRRIVQNEANASGVRRALLFIGVLSLAAATALIVLLPTWQRWLADVPADPLFGPFDPAGAGHDVLAALVHTAILCVAVVWLLPRPVRGFSRPRPTGDQRRRVHFSPATALLVLVAVDLGLSNRWLVPTASFRGAKGDFGEGEAPPRVFRGARWTPRSWAQTSSSRRFEEIVAWQRDTLWPKRHLDARVNLLDVPDSLNLFETQVFLTAARRPVGASGRLPWPREEVLRGLRVQGLLLPPVADRPPGRAVDPIVIRTEDARLYLLPPCSRAYIVHRVEVLPELGSRHPREIVRRTLDVLDAPDGPRDFRQIAVVEHDGELQWWPAAAYSPAAAEECQIVHYEPQRVEIEVGLARPGLVVLADQYYPGWELTVELDGGEPLPAPILRTDRVLRGAWLPPGRHRLIYRYCPPSFPWAAAASAVGWLALCFARARWTASTAARFFRQAWRKFSGRDTPSSRSV